MEIFRAGLYSWYSGVIFNYLYFYLILNLLHPIKYDLAIRILNLEIIDTDSIVGIINMKSVFFPESIRLYLLNTQHRPTGL